MREIRVFLTLAEELHYGRTAERLGLTASRISQTIRTLEQRVGGRLFDRTSRRVRLTPLGEQLRQGMLPAYEQLRQAFEEAQETATGVAGILRVGMYARTVGGPHMVDIVRRFQELYPACHVQLIETGFDREQVDWLRTGDIDLLAMRLPFNDPNVIIGPNLSREDRVVLVARDHTLANRPSVTYDELAPFVVTDALLPRDMMDAFAPPVTPSGHRLRRQLCHGIAEAAMRVATGELVHPTVRSFLEHHPHPDIVAVPITDLPPSETSLVWLRGRSNARVRAFAQVATAVVGPCRGDAKQTPRGDSRR